MSESDQAASVVVITQRGAPKDFLGLSLRNGLLNIVTLTLYRFWGKTIVRRRLWASTYLNGEAFEYTGLGKELFLGFLLALGVVVLPFLVIIFGAQFLGPRLAIWLVFPFYLFLGFLAGFGRFTAFRYLASRTSWRGVRFQMRGSAAKYGLAWLGYMALSVITLGWFWPAADRRMAGRLWGGLSFGDHPLKFRLEEARKEKVYGAFALGWIGGVVAYWVFVAAVMAMMLPQIQAGNPHPTFSAARIGEIYGAAFLFLLAYSVLAAPFHAAMLRSVVAGIGFGEVRFKLKVTWLGVAGLSLSNVLLLTVSVGFLMPFVEARTRRFLIDALATTGATDLSAIGQAPDLGPRTGEGLADAFGIATV